MGVLEKSVDLVGRFLLAFIFVMSGVSKIGNYAGTQGYMESYGVPGELLPVVIITEALGGLLLIIGWQTRIVAFLLAGFTLLAALFFHTDFSQQMQLIMFMKNLAIAGGLLILSVRGAGGFSLDARARR